MIGEKIAACRFSFLNSTLNGSCVGLRATSIKMIDKTCFNQDSFKSVELTTIIYENWFDRNRPRRRENIG